MVAVIDQPRECIRPMQPEDVSAVIGIETRVYPFPWTEQIFRDCLRVGYFCRVMELAGTVVGYGVLSMGAGEAHVLNLCIHPDHQRLGLGRRMLSCLIDEARRLHVQTVLLEVRVSNVVAQQLYWDAGFNEIGLRKGYYPAENGREDAMMYALALPASEE